MNEKLLLGNNFFGFSLLAMQDPDVTGFVLNIFPIMLRCETGHFGFAMCHEISVWFIGFSFSLSFGHPWVARRAKKEG